MVFLVISCMIRFEFRAKSLLSIADESLKDLVIEDTADFSRFVTREPVGVIFLISAWNVCLNR